ncbi:MAG: AraC family transcriptional regulator [Nocardioides sp.]|nr:AraC family transcriptional regulator [Nocardioides sp.]
MPWRQGDQFAPGVLRLQAYAATVAEEIAPVAFSSATLSLVVEGEAEFRTQQGARQLKRGHLLLIRERTWWSSTPNELIRSASVFADERFLRSLLGWVFPPPGWYGMAGHPSGWNEPAVVMDLDEQDTIDAEGVLGELISLGPPPANRPDIAAPARIALLLNLVAVGMRTVLKGGDIQAVGHDGDASIRSISSIPNGAMPSRYIVQAQTALRAQLATAWTLEQLAAEVTLSVPQLLRLFNRSVGMPPMRYLAQLRLEEFSRLLEQSDLSIAEISRQVGWRDPRIAARWFRQRWGVNPSMYRQIALNDVVGDGAPRFDPYQAPQSDPYQMDSVIEPPEERDSVTVRR